MPSILKIIRNRFSFKKGLAFIVGILLLNCSEGLQKEQVNEITIHFTNSINRTEAHELATYLSLGKSAEPSIIYLDKIKNGYLIKRIIVSETDLNIFANDPRKFSRDLFKK